MRLQAIRAERRRDLVRLLFLSENHVRQILDHRELLRALADGFIALSGGLVESPSRTEVAVPDRGFLLCMPAWMPGQNIAAKLITGFNNNLGLKIPAYQALICLFDSQNGTPLAIMEGSHITAMRTAGASALSAQILARSDARKLSIIGSGVQARAHLEIVSKLRDFQEIKIASRTFSRAEEMAKLNSGAIAVESIEEAVRDSDVVCLCTSAEKPVLETEWISAQAHVTSVGYSSTGSELPPGLLLQSRLFVETRLAFNPPPVGCYELAGLDPNRGTELGEVLQGIQPARPPVVTLYKSMGHGMEDLVVANLVYERANQLGVGESISL